MNPNAIIFICKIGLFRVNYTSKPGAPRIVALDLNEIAVVTLFTSDPFTRPVATLSAW